MTSDIDLSKTNEFLRRRQLRLQQVREQSKDIAKKIRQRAKVEKLRHGIDVDAKKQKEYFECQEKLVKRLELLYSKSLQNVGAGHKDALKVTQTDVVDKIDLSKLRGKEAVIELRKRKQEKLDEQKKVLDRILQAREFANEISREKSSNVAKNLTKQSKNSDNINKPESITKNLDDRDNTLDTRKANYVTRADMGTQWESTELPNEWDIPTLLLPKDDTTKDIVEISAKSNKNKRPNLFALSDEMPSSLRGGISSEELQTVPIKPSLTVVSEYLQNRNLKLREFEPVKRPTDDLQSIKNTILRTRASKADGSITDNICHVLDNQALPLHSWRAECNCGFGDHKHNCNINFSSQYISKNPININSSDLFFHKICAYSKKNIKLNSRTMKPVFGMESGNKDKSARSIDPEYPLNKKKSISVYDHHTRDLVDIPYDDDLVIQDKQSKDDAYAQAQQETASANSIDKELDKKQKDMRNKIAATRQNVDKEYRDTLAFLNSLPKNTDDRPIKTTYMDDQQQQLEKDKHQRKMQLEFKKIERECRKQNCKHNRRKTILQNNRSASKSPDHSDKYKKDFEYSWMPVPESEGSFAIHTIPATTKKSGNTVKFSEPNTYHEYRSRHKHTPPTKENDQKQKNFVETLMLQNDNESDEVDENVSESSSVENLNLDKENTVSELRDADRIIIYKIVDNRNKKKSQKKSKETSNVLKSTSFNEIPSAINKFSNEAGRSTNLQDSDNTVQNGVSLENLQEGVYKGVSSEGDNIASMYYSENVKEGGIFNQNTQENNSNQLCCCKNINEKEWNTELKNKGGDNTSLTNAVCSCCRKKVNEKSLPSDPSAATSTSSFKTAANDKTDFPLNPESGFIKMVDEGGQETGKFYIGASGFIKNDNYEVVIQLRKKEGEKTINTEKKEMHAPFIHSDIQPSQDSSQKIVQNDGKNNLDSMLKTKDSEIYTVPVNNNLISLKTDNAIESTGDKPQQLNKTQVENNVIEPTKNQINTCEKAVHTSFEDAFTVLGSLPKSDPLPRPGTSTYTQTSFNSSLQRPVFMHMSSSTSTAYMSPPELVLPNFLKQDRILTHDELFESENTLNHTDPLYEAIEDCEGIECRCKHCTCNIKKNIKSKLGKAISTPPNTARNLNRDELGNKVKDHCKKKCNSRKCGRSNQIKACQNYHKKRTISETTKSSKDVSSDKNAKLIQMRHKLSARSVHGRDIGSSKEINPLIKKYVNKLLSLNKDGLKAIEIINQDCSIASTPGSSIINVISNKDVIQNGKDLQNTISLEQIKNILKEQLLKQECNQSDKNNEIDSEQATENHIDKIPKSIIRLSKRKSVHKVKSLNISRQLLNKKKIDSMREKNKKVPDKNICKSSISTPISRSFENSEYKNSTSSDITELTFNKFKNKKVIKNHNFETDCKAQSPIGIFNKKPTKVRAHKAKPSYISSDSEAPSVVFKRISAPRSPTNISTQTNGSINVESNFMKIAEDKIQNMEKIADLTEKCTKRLSNLAKVLEEVRKNKSLVYSQISTSDSASEAENKTGKCDIQKVSKFDVQTSILIRNEEPNTSLSAIITPEKVDENNTFRQDAVEFTPILKDIPKPNNILSSSNYILDKGNSKPSSNAPTEHVVIKTRGKPPPALSRVNLKNGQDFYVTPHELSTVMEVDSPMSIKFKSQSAQLDAKLEMRDNINKIPDFNHNKEHKNQENNPSIDLKIPLIDPNLLQSNASVNRHHRQISTIDSDESKINTINLKQFNDVMLKPFISLQEYAKQCNIGLDDGSNIEDVMKEDLFHEDLSSLHSDGSLPDVIAELLKRKMISEPFRFDSASNANSTTISSESTVSFLALSNTKKGKKKSNITQKNKDNREETTETLSLSSNPDLENAFQKLGMGWASSTLKKTKERLALSSSSNTSSSSMKQFKIRTFSQDVPTLVTDSSLSMLELSNKQEKRISPDRNITNNSKNATQQTSSINSMTVKEFLKNELGKKITFSNKTTLREDDDFMSLYETNIPDNMKITNVGIEEDNQSVASANNRARTSTPVQIYKSTTYNSTSSSNASNNLFSNADELSSVKVTSTSIRNHSTSDKDDLTIPNYSLKTRKELSDFSKSD